MGAFEFQIFGSSQSAMMTHGARTSIGMRSPRFISRSDRPFRRTRIQTLGTVRADDRLLAREVPWGSEPGATSPRSSGTTYHPPTALLADRPEGDESRGGGSRGSPSRAERARSDPRSPRRRGSAPSPGGRA